MEFLLGNIFEISNLEYLEGDGKII